MKGARKRAALGIIGWREWVTLPDLGGARIKAKIDTGARTSSLHAWNIHVVDEADETRANASWVAFDIHPQQHSNKIVLSCHAKLIDCREIKSSTGHNQTRYIIETDAVLAGQRWPIELSLTRRDEMGFRMLLGRTAIRGHFLVDPGRSFLAGGGKNKLVRKKYNRWNYKDNPLKLGCIF